MNAKKAWYNRIEEGIILVLFSMMTIIMFISVVSRYCFNFTFSWAEQITRIMFVWVTFAGISLGGLRSAHMRVTAISLIIGERRTEYVKWFGDVVAICFGFFISYYMFNCTMNAINNHQVFTAVPSLNVGVMYVAGVIGMLAFSLRVTQNMVNSIRAFRAAKSEDLLTGKEGEE